MLTLGFGRFEREGKQSEGKEKPIISTPEPEPHKEDEKKKPEDKGKEPNWKKDEDDKFEWNFKNSYSFSNKDKKGPIFKPPQNPKDGKGSSSRFKWLAIGSVFAAYIYFSNDTSANTVDLSYTVL